MTPQLDRMLKVFHSIYGKDKKMEWLTKEYIKEQAQISDIAVLKCSLDHWEQIVEAGWDEYHKGYTVGKVSLWGDGGFCALCLRHSFDKNNDAVPCIEKSKCILAKEGEWCGSGLSKWRACVAPDAVHDATQFNKAAKKMRDLLKRLYERELKMTNKEKARKAVAEAQKELDKAQKYLQDCDELRHGDYGSYKSGGLWWAWDRNNGHGHITLELFGTRFGSGHQAQGSRDDMVRMGNHVDDLKRNSEDLKEFEHDNTKLSIDSDGCLRIEMAEYEARDLWHIKDPKLVAQKILQMVATREHNGK